jgi:hypothetical protein
LKVKKVNKVIKMPDSQEIVTLKEYILRIIEEHEKRDEVHRQAIGDALLKSSLELDRRLETMNEFREQINQERGSYINRQELNLMLKPLQDNMSYNKGHTAGREWIIGVLVGLVALAVAILK